MESERPTGDTGEFSAAQNEYAKLTAENPENPPESTDQSAAESVESNEGLDARNQTTKALAKELNAPFGAVKKVIEGLTGTRSEKYQVTNIAPELADQVREVMRSQRAPEGWKSVFAIHKDTGISRAGLNKVAKTFLEQHPGHSETFRGGGKTGKTVYYSPELQAQIAEKIRSGDLTIPPQPPKGWRSQNSLAKELGVDPRSIQNLAKSKSPELKGVFRSKGGVQTEFLAPKLQSQIRESIREVLHVPEGYKSDKAIAEEAGVSKALVTKLAGAYQENQEGKGSPHTLARTRGNAAVSYRSPELQKYLAEKIQKQTPPEGWKNTNTLAKEQNVTFELVRTLTHQALEQHPEWAGTFRSNSRGSQTAYFSPELQELVQEQLGQIQLAPDSWKTDTVLARELGIPRGSVQKIADRYAEDHPEWSESFKIRGRGGTVIVHRSPELIAEINQAAAASQAEKLGRQGQEELKGKIKGFLIEVSEGDSLEAQEFRQLTELFGAERAVDILYQFRPEYTKVPVPYVRSILPDYLGDYLVIRGHLDLDNLEAGTKLLSNQTLRDGLTEVIKNDCLRFYNQVKKSSPEENDLEVITAYVDHIRERSAEFSTPQLAEVLDSVAEYYRSAFEDIQKPANVIEELQSGRLFPDLNQRINIKELAQNQRLLIADEMGVGKSASAILAKESLGVEQALIVAPSNVIEVWQNYLSDQTTPTGEAIGYFKPGLAPRVLRVEDLKSLHEANPAEYDYVLLAQERLNSDHVNALERFNYGMLIVDESHKLKNLSQGKRAEHLLQLSDRVEGDDKYLALLSGTPIPNKVGDVAMVLKLLYPDQFHATSNQELTRQILKGDVLDLRSLLVPRMELKSLAETVAMPALHEQLHRLTLSKREQEIYDVLLEEDELTASQKLQTLRQFILNPALIDATPEVESTKINTVGEALQQTFNEKDKVVLFVNGYVEDVIRGDSSIITGLNLPDDVDVKTIEGSVGKDQRLEFQKQLRSPGQKMLLLVSGQTADVGVDFSGAEEAYFYNEPWTEYDKRQQLGRVYRPGLQADLISQTFYAGGTIEEGIHKYIESKYLAIEKLLRGIPLSELERELLKQDEKQAAANLEVNPELAEYYFSSWDKMLKIYTHVKESGEENFVNFLSRYGREYADCYVDLGSRSYQANASRLSGTLIDRFVKDKRQKPGGIRILDVASGPEMLSRHIADPYTDRITSLDINRHHFEEGSGKRVVGSFLNLPVADKSIDYANLSLALHYTSFLPSKGNYERADVLRELNRALVPGGRSVISLMYSLDFKNEAAFKEVVNKIGFKIIEPYSGQIEAGPNFKSKLITLEKVGDCQLSSQELLRDPGAIQGLKFIKRDNWLKDQRKIATQFSIGSKKVRTKFNQRDQRVLEEEQSVLKRMEQLKKQHKGIKNIPDEAVTAGGFSRFFNGRSHVLFKGLESGSGAVVLR